LVTLSQKNFTQLFALIDNIPAEKQQETFPFADRDKNIRDVLAHLYHWHQMLLDWYELGMRDEIPIIPAAGYTWRTLPALNLAIWQQYQTTRLADIKEKLQN